jgi:hypothetical protein
MNVRCRKGKALGSEEDEVVGGGLCYEQRGEVEQGPYLHSIDILSIAV